MLANVRSNAALPLGAKPLWTKLRDRLLETRPFAMSLQPWSGGQAMALRGTITRLIPGDPELGQKICAEGLHADTLPQFNELASLRHLTASGKTLHAIYASGLLQAFGEGLQRRAFGPACAKALFALCAEGPAIVEKVPGFLPHLFHLVTTQAKRVQAWTPHNAPDKTLRAATLLAASAVFEGLASLASPAANELDASLAELVLPDGGLVSRKGDDHLTLLLLLMPVRSTLRAVKDPVPQGLHAAIERMLPMLRMMRHGNGDLAGFFTDKPRNEVASALLEADETKGQPLEFAPHAGVARLNQGLLVLCDCSDTGFSTDISYGDCRIFNASIDTGRSLLPAPGKFKDLKEGKLLHLESEAGEVSRDLFLQRHALDLRCEDRLPAEAFIQFKFAEGVSVLSVGTDKIQLMTSDQMHWVLAQRGGVFEQGTEYQNTVRLDPDDPAKLSEINWAVRRDHG